MHAGVHALPQLAHPLLISRLSIKPRRRYSSRQILTYVASADHQILAIVVVSLKL